MSPKLPKGKFKPNTNSSNWDKGSIYENFIAEMKGEGSNDRNIMFTKRIPGQVCKLPF